MTNDVNFKILLGIQEPSDMRYTPHICQFYAQNTMGLCFCMTCGHKLYLNIPPATNEFIFPQSREMSVNLEGGFQVIFGMTSSVSPTYWCYHISHQVLKCHRRYTCQLVPVSRLTVSWWSGCTQDAGQEFLLLSQTLRAKDIQLIFGASWIWLNPVSIHIRVQLYVIMNYIRIFFENYLCTFP